MWFITRLILTNPNWKPPNTVNTVVNFGHRRLLVIFIRVRTSILFRRSHNWFQCTAFILLHFKCLGFSWVFDGQVNSKRIILLSKTSYQNIYFRFLSAKLRMSRTEYCSCKCSAVVPQQRWQKFANYWPPTCLCLKVLKKIYC